MYSGLLRGGPAKQRPQPMFGRTGFGAALRPQLPQPMRADLLERASRRRFLNQLPRLWRSAVVIAVRAASKTAISAGTF
jgi:hypothetical protein